MLRVAVLVNLIIGAGRGFANSRGLPHCELAWRCRLHPTVRRTFAAAYGVEPSDLATGLDNLFWSSPANEPRTTNGEWLHVDQNHNTGLTWPCLQGFL
jgi:hypothetical protein